MKVITQPVVQIISRPQFIECSSFEIPDDGDDATKIGAFAAKNCYDSAGKNGRANAANQKQVIEQEHGSVLEHINYGLYMTGISRALSLESNRHRPLSISQRSSRYTAEEDAAIVLEPFYAALFDKYKMEYRDGDINGADYWVSTLGIYQTSGPGYYELELICNFLNDCESAIYSYQTQVDYLMKLNPLKLTGFDLRKWARGKARNLLPHALETRITYTGNLRAWRWFIEARSDKHAEPEIRRVADHVLTALRTECPLYLEDFKCVEIYDGIPMWVPEHSKV